MNNKEALPFLNKLPKPVRRAAIAGLTFSALGAAVATTACGGGAKANNENSTQVSTQPVATEAPKASPTPEQFVLPDITQIPFKPTTIGEVRALVDVAYVAHPEAIDNRSTIVPGSTALVRSRTSWSLDTCETDPTQVSQLSDRKNYKLDVCAGLVVDLLHAAYVTQSQEFLKAAENAYNYTRTLFSSPADIKIVNSVIEANLRPRINEQ